MDPSGHVAVIENESTSDDSDALMVKLNTSDPGATNNFVTFADADGGVGAIEGNGGGGVNYESGRADVAEYFPVTDTDAEFEPGDVVGLADGGLVADPTDGDRALVVSDSSMLTGNVPEYGGSAGDDSACVALLGQVPVRISAPVEAGDRLAATPDGTVVPADCDRVDPGAPVVGHALDAADPTDDTVDAFVTAGEEIELEKLEREKEALRDDVAELEAENERKDDRIEDLESKNEELAAQNETLEGRLTALEERVASMETGQASSAPADG